MARPTRVCGALYVTFAATALAQQPAGQRGREPPPSPLAASADSLNDPLARLLDGVRYRALGPAAYSGRVTALAVPRAGAYPKTLYVGAAGGGVWKSTNGGTTWQAVSEGLGAETIGDLAVAPSDTNVVWVGTGERNSLRSQWWGDGVYKSNDGGKTWTNMGLKETRSIGRIVIHPANPNIVYVAALGHLWGPNPERGLYRSADGGKTWSRILFVDDTTGFVDLAMDPANPEVLYAAAWHRLRWGGSHMQGVGRGSGIYKTRDGGRSWTRLTDSTLKNGLPSEHLGRIGLAVAPTDPRIVYAVIQVERGITDPLQGRYGGVFRSNDAGATWTQTNDLQAEPHYYYDGIWIDPSNVDHVWVVSPFLLESRDGGKSFARDSLFRVHGDFHALWIDPGDTQHLIIANDGGVYESRDGGKAWEHMPLPIGQFYTVIVDSSLTPYQVCGGLQDNGVWCGPSRTRDTLGITDADWYPVNGGDGMGVQIPANDPFTVYSGWQYGHLSRFDVRTWKRDEITPLALDAGEDSGYPFTWGWTTPMLVSQHDPTVLYVGANHLIRMTHRGDDWAILGPDMTRANREHPLPERGHTSYHAIFAIAESPRRADLLWTGSDDGLVWRSRDGGKTWVELSDRFPPGAPTTCWVTAIAASYHAEGTAYAVYDCHFRDDDQPHVYRTEDYGATWRDIGQGLPPDRGSLTILEDPRNPRLLWVGTANGVYVTLDAGGRWRRLGNLPHVPVEALALSFTQRDLVVATHGRGVWIVNVAPLEELSDTLLAEAVHLFSVPPAYQYRPRDTYPEWGSRPYVAPNPPRGAVIAYYLRAPQPDGVKLVITTVAGDTVRHLTGPGYPGLAHVTWDLTRDKPRPRELAGPTAREELRQVPPGEYLVRLELGSRQLERRVLVEAWPADRLGRIR
ncbi:MAG TPA: hypothetical protein VEU55_00870 [Gemmatimonadales bacterium]|nr:hypothetical protein [Gemmatimonadales bacterium]